MFKKSPVEGDFLIMPGEQSEQRRIMQVMPGEQSERRRFIHVFYKNRCTLSAKIPQNA